MTALEDKRKQSTRATATTIVCIKHESVAHDDGFGIKRRFTESAYRKRRAVALFLSLALHPLALAKQTKLLESIPLRSPRVRESSRGYQQTIGQWKPIIWDDNDDDVDESDADARSVLYY